MHGDGALILNAETEKELQFSTDNTSIV